MSRPPPRTPRPPSFSPTTTLLVPVALTLDGYNDTSALSDNANTTAPVPIPAWVDTTLLDCLNDTIGEAVPLISTSAQGRLYAPNVGGLFALLFVLWRLFNA